MLHITMDVLLSLSIGGFELTVVNVLILFVLTTLAFAAGTLPGIGPAISIALLLPFIGLFDQSVALLLLGSIYMAGTYGGSISAILMNIPGTGANAATLLDGYPMSKQGKAITAISISTTSSIIGGLIGVATVYFATPILTDIVVLFGSPEYLMMIIFGLLIIAIVSKGNLLKGLLVGSFGLMIMSIGISTQTGITRYTLGIPYLYNGIPFLAVLIGVFAVTETLYLAGSRSQISREGELTGSTIEGVKTTLSRIHVALPSSAIGFIVGTIPGAGGAIANFVSYGVVERLFNSPDDPEYGKGNPNGVIAAEASNNSVVSGALVPTLTFSIPGSATTAAILGAMNLVGLAPGPQLFSEHLDSVYLIYAGVVVGVIFILTMYWAAPYLSRVTVVDRALLIPVILIVSTMGIYSLRTNMGDVLVMYVFGLLGYVLVKHNYVIIALILAVILGPQAETMFLRTLTLGGLSLLQTKPLFATLVFLVALSAISALLPVRKIAQKAGRMV